MQRKAIKLLILCLAFSLGVSSAAFAAGAKLLCVSNESLKGQQSVSSCLAKGDEFAIVDQYGIVHILTPREVALTKAFNPKLFQQRAFSLKYSGMAPKLKEMKVFGSVPLPQK
jgi:hypothetical protein